MKKIITMIAAVFMAAGMQAQTNIVTSKGAKFERVPSTTTKYIRVGLNLAGAHGDGAKGSKSVVLYDFVYGFQKPVYEGLYWGMEFGLSARGFKTESSESGLKIKNKLIGHQIRFTPIQMGYKVDIADNFKIDPHVGFYVSGDYAGSAKSEYSYGGDKQSNSQSIYDIENYQYFNLGGQFGVGVWFNNINLDFTYQMGGIDFVKDSKAKSHNFLIRLGFGF